jgi:hypothetical protein
MDIIGIIEKSDCFFIQLIKDNFRGDNLKKFILLSFLMLILTGCNEYLTFGGESDNWKGEYTTTIYSDKSCDSGKYIFNFKEATKGIEFKNIEVVIDGGRKKLMQEKLEGSTVYYNRGSGCNVTNEDLGIEVTIKWDDVHEESFLLEKK